MPSLALWKQTLTTDFDGSSPFAGSPPFAGKEEASAPSRRFVPSGKAEVKVILKKRKTFAVWAAQNGYDVVIFPLYVFVSKKTRNRLNELNECLKESGLVLEAGGRDLSSLLPRRYFLFHRDYFRMEDGKRKSDHHFCATNPGAIRVIGKEGGKLFRAAGGVKVFHLWPDKGAEAAWCSCPSCRAFTAEEQYLIGINAAADVLAKDKPGAVVAFFETAGEGVKIPAKIPLRKNTYKIDPATYEAELSSKNSWYSRNLEYSS